MASKIVSLLLQVKNAISPGADEAAESLRKVQTRARELEKELSSFESAQAALESLDGAAEAALRAEAGFEDAQLEVERLKRALKTDKTPELAVSLAKARTEAAEAKKEWTASSRAVAELDKTLKRAGLSVDDLSGAEQALAGAVERTRGKMDAHSQVLERAKKKYGDVGAAAESSGGKIKSWVAGLVGAVAGVAIIDKIKDGFVGLAAQTLAVGDEFERLSVRLSQRELGYVEEFARSTPLQLQEVADAFAKLKAFGLDPTAGSLQQLTDYNAKLGGSAADLEGMVTAVGQAFSKQKLQQEEVLQLVERGVPAWDLLAQATGKSVPELQDMASAGKLGRKELELLLDAMGAAAEGSAAEAMGTLSGLTSNLKDEMTAFLRRVSDAGALDAFKDVLKDIQAEIKAMAEDGRLQQLAEAVAEFFKRFITEGRDAAQSFNDNFGKIVGTAQIIVNLVAAVFNGLKVSIFGAAAAIAQTVAGLADLAGMDEFAAKTKAVAEGFEREFGSATEAVNKNIENIISASEQMPKTLTTVTKELSKAAEEAAAAAEKTGEAAEKTAAAVEKPKKAVNALVQRWQDLKAKIDQTGDAAGEAGSKTAAAAQQAADAAEQAGDAVADQSRDVQGLTNDLGAWFRGVRSEMQQLSAEAGAMFDTKLGIDSGPILTEMEALEAGMQKARDQLASIQRDNLQVFDPTGVNKWKNSVLAAKDETILAWGAQKQKFDEYMGALESGKGVNASFIRSAENSIARMNILGGQDLITLRNALATARAQLDQMSDSAESALVSLQNQLDSLQGNQDAINQRNYEQQRAKLQESLKEAEAYGNREAIARYKEALTTLDRVLREQKKQAAESERSDSDSAASSTTTATNSTTITLQASNGSSATLSGDSSSVDALLDVLEDAGLRAS